METVYIAEKNKINPKAVTKPTPAATVKGPAVHSSKEQERNWILSDEQAFPNLVICLFFDMLKKNC